MAATGEGLSSLPDDAKKAVINSLTLRRNFDLLYEQLEPSLLIPMLNSNLSYAEKRGRVESYQKHRHAQNAVMVESMLGMSIRTNISEICLALGGNNDQQRIAQTLLKDSQLLWSGQGLQKTHLAGVDIQSDFGELSGAFITLFQAVRKEFEQLPNGIEIIKRTLGSLVLPQKIGGMAHLVPPSIYSEAKSVDEIFAHLSSFVNPLSFYLLKSLAYLSGCTPATEKVTEYCHLRRTKSHLILCSEQSAPPTTHNGLNDLNTVALSGANSVHVANLDYLQSFHPQIFAKPQEHEHPSSISVVRISAQLNMKIISLSDYDAIVTAISGFFLLPKSALVYVGCSNQPLTLCWCVLKEISFYMQQTQTHVNSELLLSEGRIMHIMIGDWVSYKCLTLKECKLLICAYYGRLDEAPDDIDLNASNYNGWTALMLGAAQGQTTAMALLLSAGAQVDLQDKSGTTALFHASQHGKFDIMALLLQASASVNIPTTITGETPLHHSCDHGNVQTAQLLLQARPNLNLPNNNGWTPLMKASFENRDKVVQLLITAGATLDLLHRIEGFTALHCACQQGHIKVVQVLVRAGANLNIQMLLNGMTPLMKAVGPGHIEVVEILVNAGAKLDLRDIIGTSALQSACEEGHEEIVKVLIQAGASLNSQHPLTGVVPLHIVSDHGSATIAQLLIEAGANVDIANSQGWTSLMKSCFQGHNEVAELLLAAGANTDLKNQDGFTALACACQERQERAVQLLLQAKADVNIQTTIGLTALHKACGTDNITIVKYLIAAGCNQVIDAQTTDGFTALHFASSNGQAKIIELLIQAGANVNVHTTLGYTPLTMVCEKGYVEIAHKLLDAKADVNLYDQDHRTALFWAAMKGQSDVVKMLLQSGADANIKNKDSYSPFDIASISGHAEVCELLYDRTMSTS